MTVIKSLIIPKFVYIASLLPTPKDAIKELNQLLFKFLWKGVDKTTRLSVINEYEKGSLKLIDLETMITSSRLAWLKRIFGVNDGAWKDYIHHQLKCFGGLFLFHCNYNVKDHPSPSQFYAEMLQWWAEFRDEFSTEKYWHSITWNNKDVRISKAPVFYKTFFDSGIICVNDLRFDLNNLDSYNIISKQVGKVNF